jgi:hypothetical protein
MRKWFWNAYTPVFVWLLTFSTCFLCASVNVLPSRILYAISLLLLLCMGPVVGGSIRNVYDGITGTGPGRSRAAFIGVLIAMCFCWSVFLAIDAPFCMLRHYWGVRLAGADVAIYLLHLLFSTAGG